MDIMSAIFSMLGIMFTTVGIIEAMDTMFKMKMAESHALLKKSMDDLKQEFLNR